MVSRQNLALNIAAFANLTNTWRDAKQKALILDTLLWCDNGHETRTCLGRAYDWLNLQSLDSHDSESQVRQIAVGRPDFRRRILLAKSQAKLSCW